MSFDSTVSTMGDARSAFREAEKQYALRKVRVRRRWEVADVDLTDVVDARELPCDACGTASIQGHPGLLLLPRALRASEQATLARMALEHVPGGAKRTNLGPKHGCVRGMWEASRHGHRLVKTEGRARWTPSRDHDGESVDEQCPKASALLQKLRWTSLGAAYDWSTRSYDPDGPALPQELVRSCTSLVRQCNVDGEEFVAEAALVNFYRPGDVLCGHVDDAEADLEQPLVSISLGCTAVFLMGGRTREVAPTPILLRSGDVVILMGDARKCYHGLPRVFGKETQDPKLSPALRSKEVDEEFQEVAEYLQDCRINISARKVW